MKSFKEYAIVNEDIYKSKGLVTNQIDIAQRALLKAIKMSKNFEDTKRFEEAIRDILDSLDQEFTLVSQGEYTYNQENGEK